MIITLLFDNLSLPCCHIVIHICLVLRMYLLYDIQLNIDCMSYLVIMKYSDHEYG
jgi:hypothetical protein